MIKVLQIIDGKSFGGIAKLMYEVEKNISDDIKFGFITATNICDEWFNLDVNRETFKGRVIYNLRLYNFLKNNKYDVVHINSGAFFFTFQALLISKFTGVKKVIVHSHNTPHISRFKRVLINLLNPIYRKMIDVKLTCSDKATKSLFTKTQDVILIKNGIDIEKYKFNETVRNKFRKLLDIEDKIVYGHVGRFAKQKNHDFLIDVFYKLQKKQKAVLLLIGNGELEGLIKEKVKKLNISDKVYFLGFKNDIYNYLNAIDFFIFPSLHEGLPVSLIEAQTSGIPVFVSDNITDEANISDSFEKLKIDDSDLWANRILNAKTVDRKNAYKNTIKNGYDIRATANQLEKIYKSLMN